MKTFCIEGYELIISENNQESIEMYYDNNLTQHIIFFLKNTNFRQKSYIGVLELGNNSLFELTPQNTILQEILKTFSKNVSSLNGNPIKTIFYTRFNNTKLDLNNTILILNKMKCCYSIL